MYGEFARAAIRELPVLWSTRRSRKKQTPNGGER
jgi:hypothetical protein